MRLRAQWPGISCQACEEYETESGREVDCHAECEAKEHLDGLTFKEARESMHPLCRRVRALYHRIANQFTYDFQIEPFVPLEHFTKSQALIAWDLVVLLHATITDARKKRDKLASV